MTDESSVRTPKALPDGVSQATVGVRGGMLRSGFEETAEAMYLTSGYVYGSAAVAEKSFAGELDHYVYSRYGNPTVSVFEERLRLIEGAPAAFATASGMAAVFTSLGALLGAGDRRWLPRAACLARVSWCAARSCRAGGADRLRRR